jgi:hypothetical protein
VANGRYNRVRAGSGAGMEWNNRWQVLDQTGNDIEMDLNEEVMAQRDGGRNEGRDSNVMERLRVRQPGIGSVGSGRGERDENSRLRGSQVGTRRTEGRMVVEQ